MSISGISEDSQFVEESEILELVRLGHGWIDVRAPIEFANGSIEGAVNLPIMTNEERHLVGSCFKQKGREAAIQLGHRLVSGENKERKIEAWVAEFQKQTPNISLYCFRGGLRSQISQQWLRDRGVSIRRVRGGYKLIRNLIVQHMKQRIVSSSMRLISGPTGSWKTHFLQWMSENNHLSLDLEKLAGHRGSAFGKQGQQPAQIDFEHAIAKCILDRDHDYGRKPLYIEDESRLIGRCVLPDYFFEKMRSAPILWIDEAFEQRVENIFYDYIETTEIVLSHVPQQIQAVYDKYKNSLTEIKKRLGLEKYFEIMKDIERSEAESLLHNRHDSNRVWIQKLLKNYYDPMYLSSLERRKPQVLIKARTEEIKSFVSQ
jgi:tRNA 2-selenouridine synthase